MENLISDRDFILLRDLIHDVSGINPARLKKDIVVSRLVARLRELHLDSFGEYYSVVTRKEDELSRLIDRISTHTTSFFREPHHFEFLRKTVIPECMASQSRKIRIWSAGCSTGEEPYSIAIVIRDTLEAHKDKRTWSIKILASDISKDSLRTASKGIYSRDDLAAVSPAILQKYFLAGVGRNLGLLCVKDVLKEHMIFKDINLTTGEYPIKGQFDVIFCRNVVIYFDKATQEKVTDGLLRFLKPGGYFFCGHSESLLGITSMLSLVEPCIYKKTGK